MPFVKFSKEIKESNGVCELLMVHVRELEHHILYLLHLFNCEDDGEALFILSQEISEIIRMEHVNKSFIDLPFILIRSRLVTLNRVFYLSINEIIVHFDLSSILVFFHLFNVQVKAEFLLEQVFTVTDCRLILFAVSIKLLVRKLILDEISHLSINVVHVKA